MGSLAMHAGEVITHPDTLSALSSSSGAGHAMRVDRDQVSMLQPGMVVVPKGLAGGLASAVASAGGTVGIAAGITPPGGIREIPQRLPANVASTISSIIDRHSESKTTQGGTTFEKLPAAAAGFVLNSARDGYAVTSILAAEQGAVMPRQMSVFTHAGAAGLPSPSGAGQPIHNHRNNVNITVHQQGQKMTPDEITTAVRRGMRMGY
jgi:hypothetical protein